VKGIVVAIHTKRMRLLRTGGPTQLPFGQLNYWHDYLTVCLFALSLGCGQSAALPNIPPRTLVEVYASDRLWVEAHETGIRHCVLQGSWDTQPATVTGHLRSGDYEETHYLLHLWTRARFNNTHVRVCLRP
jgi:hypothetical protein